MEQAVESQAVSRRPRGFAGTMLLGVLLTGAVGCVGLEVSSSFWTAHDHPPRGEVAQVTVIWADGLVLQPDPMRGGQATAGVAGRVYLFGRNLGDPLEAQGTLIVQLFDDTPPQAGQQPVPREVWTVDAENLQRVLTKDVLGWGYNLWLPWSTYDSKLKRVHLLVQYHPEKGTDAWSSTMSLALGGTDSKPKAAPRLQVQPGSTQVFPDGN